MNHSNHELSDATFRKLFESLVGLNLVLTPDFRIVAATDSYLAATMTQRESIIGKGLFEIFPENPADPADTGPTNLRHSVETVLRTRLPYSMDAQRYDIPKQGLKGEFEVRYWSSVNVPILGEDGDVELIIRRVEDVTEFVAMKQAAADRAEEAKELQDRTKQMEAELRHILNSVRLFLWNATVHELDGNYEWDLQIADEAAASRILPIETLPGLTWVNSWYLSKVPDDRDRSDESSLAAFRIGAPRYSNEYRCRLASGEIRWFFEDVLIERRGPCDLFVMGACIDVTDLKQEEEALKTALQDVEAARAEAEHHARLLEAQASKLEEANRELESFSYSVSHDLRAPLRHINGYVEMLARSMDGQLDEKQLRYLKTIGSASREMSQLIDDLLAFSRVGRAELHQGLVNLDALVHDVIHSFEGEANERNIEWVVASLPKVVGDTAMLRQVLTNLIGNAVKYTKHRDHALIEIGCLNGHDGQIITFIKDNGAGFDMRFVHKLFGVFERLHRADEFEGTGIGLAIVRRVIERHGGTAWAESVEHQGATFYFSLNTAPITR